MSRCFCCCCCCCTVNLCDALQSTCALKKKKKARPLPPQTIVTPKIETVVYRGLLGTLEAYVITSLPFLSCSSVVAPPTSCSHRLPLWHGQDPQVCQEVYWACTATQWLLEEPCRKDQRFCCPKMLLGYNISTHWTLSLLFFAETRSDKAKRLFRHYTVGSYDSFDAPRWVNDPRSVGALWLCARQSGIVERCTGMHSSWCIKNVNIFLCLVTSFPKVISF